MEGHEAQRIDGWMDGQAKRMDGRMDRPSGWMDGWTGSMYKLMDRPSGSRIG